MIAAWVGYGSKRAHSRRHKRPRQRAAPQPRRIRRGPMQGRQRAHRFLLILAVVALALFALTITRPSPIAFGVGPLRALHVLPMLGFVVVALLVLVAAVGVWLLGQRGLVLTVLLGGLLGTMVLTLAVSNIFRAPILTRVGARLGAQTAERNAEEKEAYERVAFTPQMLGPLADFLLPADEPRIRAAFYHTYLRAFEGRYYLLVDRDQQKQEGYDMGFEAGQVAGGKAALRREKMDQDPSDPTLLTSLRESELPAYIEGFEKGYEDGWRAGYIALRE